MGNLSKRGKFIAVYEIVAGVVGVFAAIPELFRAAPSGHETAHYAIGVSLILASILSFFAGFKLLKATALGLRLSYLTQIIQLPSLVLKGFHFQLFLLAGVAIGIDSAKEVILNYYAGARLFFAIGNVEFAFVGINILPLVVIFLLMGAFKKKT